MDVNFVFPEKRSSISSIDFRLQEYLDTTSLSYSYKFLNDEHPGPDAIVYDPPNDSMWKDQVVEAETESRHLHDHDSDDDGDGRERRRRHLNTGTISVILDWDRTPSLSLVK